ncbi:MAG: hypothetical protein A3K22_02340 [Deltaproteobacteria bacterium RBG_16_42_7]|nr:MAG: hypothetical protein A3K22_02340 [Deltaproteobacteria bacterium RBG_16_42_7]
MIYVQDYDEVLKKTAGEFFMSTLHYVGDLQSWSRQKGVDLSEPSHPMRLFTEGKNLMLLVQSEIQESKLDEVIRALSVRWSLKDNASDPATSLNSVKKRLTYCLLKECAKTVKGVAGDDLLEDEWAVKEMEKLGFFHE